MAVRTLGGIARSSVSDWKEFPFAGCDVAAPVPFVLVGGGNRTRRRIHAAVGPTRTNHFTYNNSFFAAGWERYGFTLEENVATAPNGTLTAHRATFTDSDPILAKSTAVTATSALVCEAFWIRAIGSTIGLSAMLRHSSVSGELWSSALMVLTGEWQRLEYSIVFSAGATGTAQGRIDLVDHSGGTVPIGGQVLLWKAQFEVGVDRATPDIDTEAAPVTTTDWPRANLLGSLEPDWGAVGGASVSHYYGKRADGTHGRITRATFVSNGGLSAIYTNDNATQAAARYGASMFARRVSGGTQFGVNVESSASGPVAGNHFGGVVSVDDQWSRVGVEGEITAPVASAFGFVVGFDDRVSGAQLLPTITVDICFPQVEYDGISALMRSGQTNTPPFGEIVTVPAGQPRIEYGPDGIGRGLVAERASRNLFAYDGFFDGFDGPGVVTAIPGFRDDNDGNTAFGIRADTSGGLVYASQIVPTTTELTLQFVVRRGTHGTYGTNYGLYNLTTAADLAYVSIDYDTGVLTKYGPDAASMVATCVPAGIHGDFWHITMKYATGFAPGNYLNMYMGYVGNTGVPVGATHVIAWAQAEPGLIPTSHIKPETAGVVPVADAESLETFDLQALDLHNGRGTILVDFVMPEVTSGNSHGIMSCCTGDVGAYMGIYTNGGQVIAACYYAGVRYEHAFTGFAAGARVRAALTFATGYFASAVNGVPGPVTYGNNPIAYDRVITGDLVGSRSYPADTTISLAATTGRVAITDDLCEATRI